MQKGNKVRMMQVKELMKKDYIKRLVDYIDTQIYQEAESGSESYTVNLGWLFSGNDELKYSIPYAIRSQEYELLYNLAKIYSTQGFKCNMRSIDMLDILFYPNITVDE